MKTKHLVIFIVLICIISVIACKPEAEVVSISVEAENAKYWYVSGTEIDTKGLTVKARLSDGTEKEIPLAECEIEKPAFMPYGEKKVTVHYGEMQADYTVYTCPSTAETDTYTAYTIRKNENGKSVLLAASLIGEKRPFVLILPGGAYAAANYSGSEGCGYAKKINDLGYNAFVLEYSVKMEHPAPLEDVNTAYEIIEQNQEFFNISMEGYAVCGSSAGAHLAGTWCMEDNGAEQYGKPRPAAAILAYPLVSFVNKDAGESLKNLTGESPSETLLHQLSIEEHIDDAFPPTYAWIFVEDGLLTDTQLMEKALETAGVPHLFRYFKGGRHGLGLAEGTEAEGWMDEAIQFWADNQ